MSKILTVCVPTYNMEALLNRCLDSFILDKETMDKLEILIVNDGSKDNSSKIGHEYEAKYPNTFKVIDKDNGNYGSCINAALKVATGKYFRICDADDRYEKKNLGEYISFLDSSSADMVFSPYYRLNFDSSIKEKIEGCPIEKGKEVSISAINWSDELYGGYIFMHCIAVKTKNLTSNNYYQTEGISYTDNQFAFYSILYSETCAFFDKPIYYYYLGRDGQTMTVTSMIKSNMHFYENAKRLLETFVKLTPEINERKRELLFGFIVSLMSMFVNFGFGYVKNFKSQLYLINEMVEMSKMSTIPCPLYDSLMKTRHFRIWQKYHISPSIIYLLVHTKNKMLKLL